MVLVLLGFGLRGNFCYFVVFAFFRNNTGFRRFFRVGFFFLLVRLRFIFSRCLGFLGFSTLGEFSLDVF